MKKRFSALLAMIAVLVMGVFMTACQKKGTPDNGASQENMNKEVALTVSAAASLKDAMGEITNLYTKENPNVKITFNFGSSGSLQKQIEQGAPADIFISAGKKQMEALQSQGLILEDTNKKIVGNELILVAPSNSTITGFEDLTTDKVKKIAVGEPKSVPAGKYAEEVFKSLKITEKVQPKNVLAKDVKEVLAWVESGNADAGMVYESDTKTSKNLKVIAPAPKDSHSPISYPGAVIKSTKQSDEAKKFLEFLLTDTAQNVFVNYGFKPAK